MGHSRALLFIFISSLQTFDSIYKLLMSGFERRIFGVGSKRSTNWATTTDQLIIKLDL